jgi:uncharacterized protein (TIGR00369 family)
MPARPPEVTPHPTVAAPFTDQLNLRLEHTGQGESVVTMAPVPDCLDRHGAVHVGVVMTLLDSAMRHAALSRLTDPREVVTVDLRVGFMRAAQGRLVARGQAIGGGKSICFCEAQLVDETGEVRAQAMGTFRYRNPA